MACIFFSVLTCRLAFFYFHVGDYGFGGGLREVEDLTRLQRLQKYLDSDNIFNR